MDNWAVENEQELREYMQGKFGHIEPKNHSDGIVTVLHPRNIEMYSDRFNAALTVFPYVDASLIDIMHELSEFDIKEVLDKSHEHREKYDLLHPAISHGGLMFELIMGYHGYRDIFRHRRGSRSTQLLTTRLGFETPEIFREFDLDNEYSVDMEKCAEIYEEARKIDPHVAEKLVPFGANCRSLYSWQPNQVAYISRLRGDIAKGNSSYVKMAREMAEKVAEIMPETSRFFRVDGRQYPAHLWKAGYGWYNSTKEEAMK